MHRHYLIAVLLIYGAVLSAQNGTPLKHEIGITGMNYEKNIETMNHPLALKLVPGIYYSRHYLGMEWISRASYGDNPIDDDCESCAIRVYGLGRLRELNLSTGIKYNFFQRKNYQLLPFVETGIYHSRIHYTGNFEGGFTGGGFMANKKQWSTGIIGRLGLSYSPNGLLTLSVSTSYRMGIGGIRYASGKKIPDYKTYNGSLLQFSAGYRF